MVTSAAERPNVLWLELSGGGLAWLAHLLVVYVIGEFACTSRFWVRDIAGIMGISWLLFLVTAATLGGVGLAIRASYRHWIKTRDAGTGDREAETSSEVEGGSGHLTAQIALITNIVFALVIVVQTIPIFFFLKDCGTWAR